MSATSKIEWTEKTWNPMRGCSIVSPGCHNCYAMKQAHRFSGAGKPYEGLTKQTKAGPQWTGKIRIVEEALLEPLSWRKPRLIFVNSMSDLFHENVPRAFIARVFAVMCGARQHTFQILTKRSSRLREIVGDSHFEWEVEQAADDICGEQGWCHLHQDRSWPLSNVWLGVSVEDRLRRNRIDDLRRTPAAVRFVSFEPLLEDVSEGLNLADIHLGIWGGESNPGARPCAMEWIERGVRVCRAQGVSPFVKQLGARPFYSSMSQTTCNGKVHYTQPIGSERGLEHRDRIARGLAPNYAVESMELRLRDRKGGDMSEWPEDLRVREFPRVEAPA